VKILSSKLVKSPCTLVSLSTSKAQTNFFLKERIRKCDEKISSIVRRMRSNQKFNEMKNIPEWMVKVCILSVMKSFKNAAQPNREKSLN
jgi:hypothetical protein